MKGIVIFGACIGGELCAAFNCGKTTPVSRVSQALAGRGVQRRTPLGVGEVDEDLSEYLLLYFDGRGTL